MTIMKKILIVDDDRDLLRGLTLILKANGYDVITAVDGISAGIIGRQQRPDLVLLDLGLPGGDGFTVLERFRAVAPLAAIPVIIHSALDPATYRDRALKGGAVDYLQKPADNPQLLSAIQRALGGSPTTDTADLTTQEVPEALRKNILIVDDDPDMLRGMSVRLRASGYNTIVAADAIAAISKARKEHPDLILLDITMPGGDGYAVLQRLQASPTEKYIPVIVVSAKDPALNREKAIKAGARAYLQKPVNNDLLISEIRKALSR